MRQPAPGAVEAVAGGPEPVTAPLSEAYLKGRVDAAEAVEDLTGASVEPSPREDGVPE